MGDAVGAFIIGTGIWIDYTQVSILILLGSTQIARKLMK